VTGRGLLLVAALLCAGSVHAAPVPPGSATTGKAKRSAGTGMLNLNTATLDQLETLSGIGEVLAQRILDYREEHGAFKAVEDLLNVSGIGDKRLADLKPHITV